MRLTKIEYVEFPNDSREWRLQPLEVGDVNLVVGKNSAGKSRVLNIIVLISRLVSNRQKPSFFSTEWNCWFEDDGTKYFYELKVADRNVTKERLTRNGDELIDRGADGSGTIYSEKTAIGEFQTPTTDLAVVNRRDNKNHPFLEKLHDWGMSVFSYVFSTMLPPQAFAMMANAAEVNLYDQNSVVAVYNLGVREFGQSFLDAIIKDMSRLGYPLNSVSAANPTFMQPIPAGLLGMSVQESDLQCPTEQMNMSQGMFRALSVLIQFNYASMSSKAGCVIVDDIGEGLDYERSCDLIDVLTAKASPDTTRPAKVQLILSTNDRFVMNRVPLQSWTLLKRKSGVVSVYNYANHKRHFDDFKFTGMNNFDFFATDFLGEELEKTSEGAPSA